MDALKAVETYIAKMVSVPSAMKVLLLDTHTVSMSSFARLEWVPISIPDARRVACVHPVDPAVSPGLSHRPDRQQEARSNAAHEVCLLSPEQRRQSRGVGDRTQGT